MRFKEFGKTGRPVVVLLHGGGLSWWSLEGLIGPLSKEYRVVAPVIDGHGEDGAEPFVSIGDSAGKLISWIDENAGGRVRALCGLSLGAQIAVEALSRRSDLAECAILESALVVPMRGAGFAALAFRLSYGLIRQKWFSRLQARALGLPENLFESYYRDSLRMSRETLVNIAVSNGSYRLKPSIAGTRARVLVVVGGREIGIMRASARKLCAAIPGGRLYVAEGMRHGELSLHHPAEYLGLLDDLLSAR